MNEYEKHSLETIDLSILDRITEKEIKAWMVAKAHSINSEKFPISNFELEVWHRRYSKEDYYDSKFSFYVAGEHGYGPAVDVAVREAKEKIAGNPRMKAAEKRRQAAAAVKEAEKLEALAQSLNEPSTAPTP